jgi:protein O-mannosyl-transferase
MKVIDTDLFIHTISDIHKNDDHRKFCFVLGAGASYTSGIKTGNHMASDWYNEIEKVYKKKQSVFDDWIKEQKIDINKLGVSYGSIYRKRFENDKHSGYDSLANAMKDAKPSYGYIILSQILTKSSGHCIVTTNFDSLIEASIFQFTNKSPLVCGHESLSAYARPHQTHPLIVKIHRDLLLSPKSDPDEISKLDPAWQAPLDAIFSTHIPIVIGYGGNDEGLMSYFESMKTPSNFFWCDLNVDNIPQRVVSLIEKHDGKFVSINGFDELMHEFGHAFDEINLQDKIFEDIAKERTSNILNQKASIRERKETLEKEYLQKSNDNAPILEKAFSALEYGDLIDKETNLEKKRNLYEEALEKYPTAGWLWWSYSYFLHFTIKDFLNLDEVYNKALEYNKADSGIIGNIAIYNEFIKKDYDKAEEYYLKSLNTELPNLKSYGNYAGFLKDIRKDYKNAEFYYKKAIETDPINANAIGNYANFLTEVMKEHSAAEENFMKAIQIDPNNITNLVYYSLFLEKIKNDQATPVTLYSKAIALDAENSFVLGNYANFLKNIKKDNANAELYYKKAIEANPTDYITIGNYANLLKEINEDYDSAEKLYLKALSLEPNNVTTITNYAYFLENKKKDLNQAEALYLKALMIEPKNSDANNDYANFLNYTRKNSDKAEEYYKKAIALDGKNPLALGSYAGFLYHRKKDYNTSQKLFVDAIALDSNNIFNNINYGIFLSTIKNDYVSAKDYYLKAINADPKNASFNRFYAQYLLEQGYVAEAENHIDVVTKSGEENETLLESWFLKYAFYPKFLKDAENKMEDLLAKNIKSDNWSFAEIIKVALKKGHPNPDKLEEYATRITAK